MIVAFALRERDDDGNPLSADEFAATVAMSSDGQTLRVHERLKEGGGTIVTDDPQEIEALRYVHGLEEVPVPSHAPTASKAAKPAKGGDGS